MSTALLISCPLSNQEVLSLNGSPLVWERRQLLYDDYTTSACFHLGLLSMWTVRHVKKDLGVTFLLYFNISILYLE